MSWTWLDSHLQLLTALATVVLIGCTIWMAHRIHQQTQAANRATEEAIWTNKENYYARMLDEAQGPPGIGRDNATFALIQIAEEWGEGRRRREIIRLFRYLATEEGRREVTATGGGDGIAVSSVLDVWDRHGVEHGGTPPMAGVDHELRPASLISQLRHAIRSWWHHGREPKAKVLASGVQKAVDVGSEIMRAVGNKLRSSGHEVIESGGLVSLYKASERETLMRPTEVDWSVEPKKIQGASLTWSMWLLTGENRPELGVELRASFSSKVPNGEWKVSASVRENLPDGYRVVWKWRSDGPRWLSRHQDLVDEAEGASTGGLNALVQLLHESTQACTVP